ncbi:type II toxin-antitoxin system RelE/ParE family toxin [Sphingobium phenoxybenzoativorans]|uniref:type II toxin-antitoxin system RelE/ParE family toxin n=1 Tax=Sphingobium phenoxybenzoativorans TaxID=1592790 RepID=UPI000872C2C9|nr:type II toxin-antitoxin system RelE/ParE family toxin [Sphingobium phenoxybenzoativorans]
MTNKMFEVFLTQGAEDDLEALHTYVAATRSSDEADGLLDALLEKIMHLESFPLRGHVPPELEALGIQDFREISLPPYRLIYRVIGSQVMISLIADARRNMQALLERRILGRS